VVKNALNDYHLLGSITKMNLGPDVELHYSVAWTTETAVFFAPGIQKLIDKYDKSLNEFGHYVDKSD